MEARTIAGKTRTQADLKGMTLSDLTDTYNRVVGPEKAIRLFKDKPTGIQRLWNIGKPAEAAATNGAAKVNKVARKGRPGGVTAPKAAPGAKAPKAARKASAGGARNRNAMLIRVVQKTNPNKPGRKNFQLYAKLKDGMTFGDAKDLGYAVGHLYYFLEQGWIKLEASN